MDAALFAALRSLRLKDSHELATDRDSAKGRNTRDRMGERPFARLMSVCGCSIHGTRNRMVARPRREVRSLPDAWGCSNTLDAVSEPARMNEALQKIEPLPVAPSVEATWRTQGGERIPYSKMRTAHLFYALRMIWNHTAPPEFQIEGGRYDGPESWPVEVRRRKVQALVAELSRRKPLPAWMVEQLKQMQAKGLQLEL